MTRSLLVLVISTLLFSGCDIDRYDHSLAGRRGVTVLPVQFLEGEYHYLSRPEEMAQWLGEVRIRKASLHERMSRVWRYLEWPSDEYVFEILHGKEPTGQLIRIEKYLAQFLKIGNRYFLEMRSPHGLFLVRLNWTHYGLLFTQQALATGRDYDQPFRVRKYKDLIYQSHVHVARVENATLDEILNALSDKPNPKLLVAQHKDSHHFDFMADSERAIRPFKHGPRLYPKIVYNQDRCGLLF